MNVARQSSGNRVSASGRRLTGHLDSLITKGDLGALALLRRGLGQEVGDMPEMYMHVLPYLSIPDTVSRAQQEREEDAGLLVASLYALWHQGKARPVAAEGVSVGTAFQQMTKQADSDNIERRFVTLLKASHDRLPDQLRHAISLMRANSIPLDWALLYSDLCQWDNTDQREQHPVRRRWARDFWQRGQDSEDQVEARSTNTSIGDENEDISSDEDI